MKLRLFLLFCNLIVGIGVFAQDFELQIQVKDKSTSKVIEFANVFITPCSCGGTTGKEGIFEIELEPKEYQVVSSIIGFENDTTIVLLEKNTLLEIYLYPTNYQLENLSLIHI